MSCGCDLILLDSDFAVCGIIEDYSELSWVRRYFSPGEFSLTLPIANRKAAVKAKYLYNQHNGETAVIEELNICSVKPGEASLKLSGRMLESLLCMRVIDSITDLTGYAENLAHALVTGYAISSERCIPRLILGPAAGYTEKASVQYYGISLAEALYNLLGGAGLSPRLTYDYENEILLFTVYGGLDRTQEQSINSRAIFSSEYENIQSSLYTFENSNYRNFFYIAGGTEDDGSRRTATLDLSHGNERREYFVDARNLQKTYKNKDGNFQTVSDTLYLAMLQSCGYKAASEHAALELVWSTAADKIPPVYRRDYDIGDICDYADTEMGIQLSLRVAEVTELRRGGTFSVHLKLSNKLLLSDKTKL